MKDTGKILAKINIDEHILPIFLIIFQWQFLKNGMSDLAEIWELSLDCLSATGLF